MKILICGWGRSGKDELAKLLGLSYRSSSEVVLEHAIWDQWGKDRYASIEDCFADRSNHRQTWYEMIQAFNSPDKARLAKIITNESECYVGLRCALEFAECKRQNVFDLTIWVDAEGRVPEEESCKVTKEMCDVSFDNKGTYEEYLDTATKVAQYLEGFRVGLDLGNHKCTH